MKQEPYFPAGSLRYASNHLEHSTATLSLHLELEDRVLYPYRCKSKRVQIKDKFVFILVPGVAAYDESEVLLTDEAGHFEHGWLSNFCLLHDFDKVT